MMSMSRFYQRSHDDDDDGGRSIKAHDGGEGEGDQGMMTMMDMGDGMMMAMGGGGASAESSSEASSASKRDVLKPLSWSFDIAMGGFAAGHTPPPEAAEAL